MTLQGVGEFSFGTSRTVLLPNSLTRRRVLNYSRHSSDLFRGSLFLPNNFRRRLNDAIVFHRRLRGMGNVLPTRVSTMTLLAKRSNHAAKVRIPRGFPRLLQQRLGNIKPMFYPRLTRFFHHRKVRFHLTPRITLRLPKRTTRNGNFLRTFVLRRH